MFKIKVVFDDAEPVIVEILARDLVRLEQEDPSFAKERGALGVDVAAGRVSEQDGQEAAAALMSMTRLYTLAWAALGRQKRKGIIDVELPATLEAFIDSADVENTDDASTVAGEDEDPTVPAPTTG